MRRELMSQREFEHWFRRTGRAVLLRGPATIVPCRCGDVNCYGWRFLPVPNMTAGSRARELWTRRN